MPKLRIYRSGKLICETSPVPGETLLQCISAAGVYIDAPCGGEGKCRKCMVKLSPGGEGALACETIVSRDMDVYLPEDAKMEIAGVGDPVVKGSGSGAVARKRLGVAIDIGTTTVVAHLTDMETGERVATASGANAQKPYGADVITRIKFSSEKGHEKLTALIREQISRLIRETCEASGACARDISYVSIAANTIMEHLAAGLSPVGMGTVPFKPVSLFGDERPVWEEAGISEEASIYYAPAISAYVGGDITAGMLAAGLAINTGYVTDRGEAAGAEEAAGTAGAEETARAEKAAGVAGAAEYCRHADASGPAVYLDIGTNGEIALKTGNKYYCCATAAGPAFEGAEIAMGMAATAGAISHVSWDGGLKLNVIGGGAPRGLCGSGLIDALAVLLETGAVDETGKLLDASEIGHGIAAHVGKIDGRNAFMLTGGATIPNAGSVAGVGSAGNGGTAAPDAQAATGDAVFMTELDVRKLQLAKSAIAAGIDTLLEHVGITEAEVRSFILAGGFGSFMDKYSAARIGLFPKAFLPVAKALGNTAGEGAALALCSAGARKALEDMRRLCSYIELSTSKVWNERFIDRMMFPEG